MKKSKLAPLSLKLQAMVGLFAALTAVMPSGAEAQPSVQTVFFDVPQHLVSQPIPVPTAKLLAVPGYVQNMNGIRLIARLYLPDPAVHGSGPYPAVVVIHGSGGMWPNNIIPDNITANNAPSSQFRDWGNLLGSRGYACLITDSYQPRGISGSFSDRRPHYDPLVDDHVASPNYERPKDVVAALEYLNSRSDIDIERTALLGFSHGAQTGLNTILDPSVDLGTYQVDFVDLVENPDAEAEDEFIEQTVKKTVPGPVRIPEHLPFPKFCAFYYGGGGHFSYHGSPNSEAAGRYMADRRTKVILFHGTGDSLMGISDINASPITGNLYPLKQVLASAAQAATLSIPNPIVRHFILNRTAVHAANVRVGHSFDDGSVVIAAESDWDTANETPNQKARRLARAEVLKWLDFTLKPAPEMSVTVDAVQPDHHTVGWFGREGLQYRLFSSETLVGWAPLGMAAGGADALMEAEGMLRGSKKIFYRLEYGAIPPPLEAPENEGFFVPYSDFGL